ncbi:MAG: hypothetical protein ABJ239_00225 [Erythrobacter sp.]
MKKLCLAVPAAALFAAAVPVSPVQAQAWIGQVVGDMMAQQAAAAAEASCMAGEAPVADEIVEALTPSNQHLQSYFSAMQSGGGPRSAFFAIDKRTAWTHGDVSLDRNSIDQGSDSLAVAGNTLDSEPFDFVRSFSDATAYGQWPVRNEAGQIVGVYNAFFVRKLGDWKLRTLTLEDTEQYSGPIAQFCHKPGDVLPYRLESSANMMEWHGNRLTKAEAKHAKALEKQAKYEAKLAEKPDSARTKERLENARAKTEKWAGEITERQTARDKAAADHEAALADQANLPTLKQEAKTKLGMVG